MTIISSTFDAIDTLNVDTIVVGLVDGELVLNRALALLDWRLCGLISQKFRQEEVSGKNRALLQLSSGGKIAAKHCLLAGLGTTRYLASEECVETELKWLIASLNKQAITSCAFIFPDDPPQLLHSAAKLLKSPQTFNCSGIFAAAARSK